MVCGRIIAKPDHSNISGDIMHLSLVNRTILMQHIGDKLVFPIQHYLRATYARRLCHRQNGQNAAIIGALTLCPPRPHQPRHFPFPKKVWEKQFLGKAVLRAFQASWFDKWSFLHYDEANDWVVCHTCVLAFNRNMLKSTNAILHL